MAGFIASLSRWYSLEQKQRMMHISGLEDVREPRVEDDPAETCRTHLRNVLRIDRRISRSVARISRGAGSSLEGCIDTLAIG